jgi:hypothetical protein
MENSDIETQSKEFKPWIWVWLSIPVGVFWLPITFGSLIIPIIGPGVALVLLAAPLIYVGLFAGQAREAQMRTKSPSGCAVWFFAVLQLIIIMITVVITISYLAGIPELREWMDIGDHIA